MASFKIFAVLLLTTIIGTVVARPGYGGYIRHSYPISYASYSYPSYSYPSYSYPSYGHGHGLYSSYSYPLHGYGHGGYGHGLGGWLGDFW